MEDLKPAAREIVLIALFSENDAAASSTPSNTTTIDLTNDSSWVNLVSDDSQQDTRKRAATSHTRPRKKRKTSVDCSICLETVEAFQGYRLAACGHEFCRSCLHGYIQSKLSSRDVSRLPCPDTDCDCLLDTSDVRACTLELGDATSWRSFQEIATESFLDTAASNTKDMSIHRCPSEHCNFTFQYESTGNPQQGQLFGWRQSWTSTRRHLLQCNGGNTKIQGTTTFVGRVETR